MIIMRYILSIIAKVWRLLMPYAVSKWFKGNWIVLYSLWIKPEFKQIGSRVLFSKIRMLRGGIL